MPERPYLKYMNFGWQLLAGMGLCVAAGYLLSRTIGHPFGIIFGLLLGVSYGGFLTWSVVRELSRRDDNTNKG